MSELNTAATNILNRLVAAPTYHPGNADLFTDWNLQAGDVVTVAADGENYSVPIYNMKLKWTGQSKVEVESTGNPKREPPPAVNRKSFGSAAGGYGGQKQLSDTLHEAGLFVDPETGVWAYASEQGEDYALGATFSVQSTAINLKVSKGNVSTQLAVECGNVHVSGGNLTVDGYITSEGLKTTTIQVQGVDCRGDIDSQGVRASSIMYGNADVGDAVSSFDTPTASGGTITIPYHTIDGGSGNITFNIADTQYYQQGVSAARSAGWTQGYSAGVSAATPDDVSVVTDADNPSAGSNNKWYSHINISTLKSGETLNTFTNELVEVTKPYNAGVASVSISRVQNNSGTQTIYNDSSGNLSISVYVRISSGTSGTYTISVPYRCID